MTSRQTKYILISTLVTSALLGIMSFYSEDSGLGIAMLVVGIGYVTVLATVIFYLGKLTRILTSIKTSPKAKQWIINRLVIIAVLAIITFIISYIRTH